MVSIIIPVYNADKFLRESIESILRQTYSDLEILVCDDKSTDRSLELLYEFNDPRIKIINNTVNQGYLHTVNCLVKQTTGDFIAFQDADDISHPRRIELELKAILENEKLGLVGTNFAVINSLGIEVRRQNVESDQAILKERIKEQNLFQKPSILFKREVYTKVGMFREGFLQLENISEDYDWILRVSELFEVGNVNYEEPLYLYRSVPGAMTKSFTNPAQLFGHTIVKFLAEERKNSGRDSLDRGDYISLSAMIEKLKRPYQLDKSLFFHEKASMFVYSGMKLEAVKTAMAAVKIDPFRLKNYRLFLYCVREWLFHR